MHDQREGEGRDAGTIDEDDVRPLRSDAGSETPGWAGEPAAARRSTEDVAATPTEIPEDLRDTYGNAAPGVGDATQTDVRAPAPHREGGVPSDLRPTARADESDPGRPYFERGQVGPYVTGETRLGREEDETSSSPASTAVPAADADPGATYPLPDRVERPHAPTSGTSINERLTTDPSGSRTAEADLPEDRPMGPPGGGSGPVEEPPGGGTWGSG
jgi:hypothetical protein